MTTSPPTPADPGTTRASDPAPSVVRSEEQLRIGTETRAVRRVRVRKRVVSQEVTYTATLRREELVVEEEDLEPGVVVDHTTAGNEIVMVLHEERVQTRTVVVPVERVTAQLQRVESEQTVTDVLRREHVNLDPGPPVSASDL